MAGSCSGLFPFEPRRASLPVDRSMVERIATDKTPMTTQKIDKRRVRERLSDQLETLLRAMTFDQLKTVLSILSQGRESRPRTLAEVEEKILGCGRPVREIEQAIYAVEATTPYPHCFLAKLEAIPQKKQKRQLRLGFDVRLVHKVQTDQALLLTFERDIKIKDWVLDEKSNTKHPQEKTLRQPAVVRVNRATSVVTINYPSFPHWHSTPPPMRLSYVDFVNSILSYLDEKFDILTAPLPTRECINRLLEARSDRLILRRTNTIPDSGKLSIASTKRNLSVEKILAQHYGPYLKEVSVGRLEEAIAEATRNSSMESMVVMWTQENVVARIDFWDQGTDLLFTWYETERDYAAVDSVVNLILQISHEIEVPARLDIWNTLSSASPGHIFLPGDLMARIKSPPEEIKSVIMDAVCAGIVEPVYKHDVPEIAADEIDSEWTPDLASLNRLVSTASGTVIDGRDPAHIRIAFRRTNPKGTVL